MVSRDDDVKLLREIRDSGLLAEQHMSMVTSLDEHVRECLQRSDSWPFYIYQAVLAPGLPRYPEGVIDGDTVIVDIDNGLRQWVHGERLRLFGIDAPETFGDERQDGLEAKEHLLYLVRKYVPDRSCVVRTYQDKRGKYGRYIAELWTTDRLLCLNALMVAHGYAEWCEY